MATSATHSQHRLTPSEPAADEADIKTRETLPVLLIISILSPLIPLIAGFKKRSTLLWLYVATGLTFDIIVTVQKRLLHVNQHPASNLFVLVEFVMISFIYKKKIIKNNVFFYLFVSTLSLFFVIHTLATTIYILNAFAASFFSFSYIIYCIIGFYTILHNDRELFLERISFFWVNIAFIIYASGNLLLFLFLDYLRKTDSVLFLSIWRSFFLFLNISKNIILAIALSPKTTDK